MSTGARRSLTYDNSRPTGQRQRPFVETRRPAQNRRTINVPKTWRSELPLALLFWLTLIVCVPLSRLLPWTVIRGEVLPLAGWSLMVELPLLWLIPALLLGVLFFRLYNVRYAVTADGLEWTTGILWTTQEVRKMALSDLLTIEPKQTLIERFLDIGSIEFGSAATDEVEIVFSGISSPRSLQRLVEYRRSRQEASGG